MEDGLTRILYNYLIKSGMGENLASYLNLLILLVAALVLAWIMDLIIWKILRYPLGLPGNQRPNSMIFW